MPQFTPRTKWPKLVKAGLPVFVVARRPIKTLGKELAIGDVFPADMALNKVRLRQLYEQRWIDPIAGSDTPRSVKATAATHKPATQTPIDVVSSAIDSPFVNIPVSKGGYTPRNKVVKSTASTASTASSKRKHKRSK